MYIYIYIYIYICIYIYIHTYMPVTNTGDLGPAVFPRPDPASRRGPGHPGIGHLKTRTKLGTG